MPQSVGDGYRDAAVVRGTHRLEIHATRGTGSELQRVALNSNRPFLSCGVGLRRAVGRRFDCLIRYQHFPTLDRRVIKQAPRLRWG